MRRADFEKSPSGRLVRVEDDIWAFIPNPLPPELVYDQQLVTLLGEAEASLGVLRGIGEQLSNPRFLITPYMHREAVLSSRIEGTRTTLPELFQSELESRPERSVDIIEVQNYLDALDRGLEMLPNLPLSLRFVREMHRTLLSGVRGREGSPGEFRRNQKFIGSPGAGIRNASFIPPPVPEMHDALNDWERFLHLRDEVPILIQCALIHYQFEAIHPFYDGNGRVGRLLITLFLCERQRLNQPLLYLSAFFEKSRSDYYERLLAVSRDGDWTSWLRYFLLGVSTQSRDAVAQAHRIVDLHGRYRDRLLNSRASAATLATLDLLFTNPYVTATRIASQIGTTPQTAQNILDRLVRAKILRAVDPKRRWRRTYHAHGLMEILES